MVYIFAIIANVAAWATFDSPVTVLNLLAAHFFAGLLLADLVNAARGYRQAAARG